MPDEDALDAIARGLARGMSRREALRTGGAALMAAVAMSPGDAWAKVTRKKRCPHHRVRCGTRCCPSGEVCVHPKRKKHHKHRPAPKCACPPHTERCQGQCVQTQSDQQNCGQCGNACGPGEHCANGQCVCAPGQTKCGNACVNTTNDPQHCGNCATVCAAGSVCTSGACASTCASGETECNGSCVNLQSDPNNCGACGNICAPGTSCSAGTCVGGCPPGQTDCNGTCVNTQTDPNNCGACGNICAPGTSCSAGTCGGGCPPGQTDCNGTCVNLQTDPRNCGACGTVCAGGQVCSSGTCTGCPTGDRICGDSCCAGPGCCGSACQTMHNNGVGQNYFDCGALGVPGNPSTYSHAMADEAAGAAAPGVATTDSTCQGAPVVVVQTSSGFATWAFSGPNAGHVTLSNGAPICPKTTDPTWT